MAVADWDSIAAHVTSRLARNTPDFVAALPDMVGAAEERLYYGFGRPGDPLYVPALRTTAMEIAAAVAVTDGVGALPADFLGARVLSIGTGQPPLTFLAPDEFRARTAGSGQPAYYTIEAGTLKTWPLWTGTIDLLYWRRFDPLAPGDDATNALLQAHTEIYKVAVRAEAYGFTRNQNAELTEVTRLAGMVTAANAAAAIQRYPGRMRIASRSGGIG